MTSALHARHRLGQGPAASGTTGMAALGLGCDFIGIELREERAQEARRRVAGPLFVDTPAVEGAAEQP